MAKKKYNPLFQLIKSLSLGEKRDFTKRYIDRHSPKPWPLFYQMFRIIDKMKQYDETQFLNKIEGLKPSQVANVKAHLYEQLLKSLRSSQIDKQIDIGIREIIDFASVLYSKGFYRPALDQLKKAKKLAKKNRFQGLVIEIIEFEKHIESQNITRSTNSRSKDLVNDATHWSLKLNNTQKLSNLTLQLYGRYLQRGHIRNMADFEQMKEDFTFPDESTLTGSFYERLYWYQSHIWFHYINLNFDFCYRYARYWVDMFDDQYPDMKITRPSLYLKGMHYLLNSLFYLQNYPKFIANLEKLNQFKLSYASPNLQTIQFLYQYKHQIDRFYFEADYTKGVTIIPELKNQIELHKTRLDKQEIMVFYYRVACLYFGNEEFGKAITHLNLIINEQHNYLREDIQCFARILKLIAHFDRGDDVLVPYQIKFLYRFLYKMKDLQQVQLNIIQFLRKLPRIKQSELKGEFVLLKEKLVLVKENPLDARPFIYLDMISWLDSKIEGRPMKQIMRRKFLQFLKDKKYQLIS